MMYLHRILDHVNQKFSEIQNLFSYSDVQSSELGSGRNVAYAASLFHTIKLKSFTSKL